MIRLAVELVCQPQTDTPGRPVGDVALVSGSIGSDMPNRPKASPFRGPCCRSGVVRINSAERRTTGWFLFLDRQTRLLSPDVVQAAESDGVDAKFY